MAGDLAWLLDEVRALSPATVAELVDSLGESDSRVRRGLRELEAKGLVESDTYQRRERVFLFAGEE